MRYGAEPSFTESITPYLPFLGVILGGLIVGAFAIWNRRRGAVETRAPDVNEMWVQTEKDRRIRRLFEDLFYTLLTVFRSYVRRVQSGGSTDLTPTEQAVHDREPRPEEIL